MKQITDVFEDILDPDFTKYVCAPCSNCKGQIRDMFSYFKIGEQYSIVYGGLVELIVNAMVDTPVRYLEEVPVMQEVPATDREALV